jgi:hypothetical protein
MPLGTQNCSEDWFQYFTTYAESRKAAKNVEHSDESCSCEREDDEEDRGAARAKV